MASLFFAGIILFFAGSVSALVFSRNAALSRFAAYAFALAGSASTAASALMVLASGSALHFSFLTFFSYQMFSFTIDALSAFFILIVGVVGIAVSLFSFSYAEHYEKKYSTGLLGFLYTLFLCSMALVLASDSVITFLIAWELMSLLSYFLVIYEHRKPAALKAGFLYVVMTHLGTIFLIVAFFLFYKLTGSFQFSDFHSAGAALPHLMRNIIFLFAFIGFGSKAGVVPFHVWLPEAHPAAPSHVSALMSGAMIKIAVYGIIRVSFDLLGGPAQTWWGVLILIAGTLSAIIGILYANSQHDLKRLLAYSSVENIGIILMGVGSSLLFVSSGHSELAAIALCAALFHALNHALFKSLLFLGAGAIHKAVGILNIEKLGGLAAKMPATAICFLIGSMAIAALPPLNGFASEWLVFQGLLGNMATVHSVSVQVVAGLSVALLALTGALALSTFAKAFSITFLAVPRSDEAVQAKESKSVTAGASMAFLASLCILLGVLPFSIITFITPVFSQLHLAPSVHADFSLMAAAHSAGTASNGIAPGWIALAFAGIVIVAGGVAVLLYGRHKKRIAPTWACGRHVEPRMEYTGSGLAMPFKLLFSGLYRPTHNIEREMLHGSTYLITAVKYEEKIEPLFERYLYDPLAKLALWGGSVARRIQTGNLNMYLLYIFGTLVFLLYFFV